jgi:hypothetical protein
MCGGDGESEQELELTVEYNYTPPCRGAREAGTGLALEPDDPESIEVESVTDAQGVTVELTPTEAERVELVCFEDVADRRDEAMEERGRARADYSLHWGD